MSKTTQNRIQAILNIVGYLGFALLIMAVPMTYITSVPLGILCYAMVAFSLGAFCEWNFY